MFKFKIGDRLRKKGYSNLEVIGYIDRSYKVCIVSDKDKPPYLVSIPFLENTGWVLINPIWLNQKEK